MATKMAQMKVGAGTEDGVVIGPMINAAAIDKIERHVADALSKGAHILSESNFVPAGEQYARPLVLGGAPLVNVLYSMYRHPPAHAPNPLLYVGFLVTAVGAGMVLYFKPPAH